MNREEACANKQQALEQFHIQGKCRRLASYGSGHINDTFLAECTVPEGVHRYILQRINHEIFTNPEELMENIAGVTTFLRERIVEQGGDPMRETLNLLPTKEGRTYYRDVKGCYWRVYEFIEGASTYDQVRRREDFYESAVAFGNFQRLLAEYPADTLHETIPNFHNTVSRYEDFLRAVEEDRTGRAAEVQPEIRFLMEREERYHILCDLKKSGRLPLRVTHNDTKLNNIMIDNRTHRGICVIDLDTVMPGLAVNDFGDSIRFGASTAAEDEVDLEKVRCDLGLFELYTRGFIRGCGGSLTDMEIRMLPEGARTMTLENALRFLTDYLQGDIYYKIHHPRHNLDRARTQIRLAEDMEKNWQALSEIVQKTREELSGRAPDSIQSASSPPHS